MRRDALGAELRERPVEPPARRGPPRVLVDDVALARVVDRRDHGHADRPLLGAALERQARDGPIRVTVLAPINHPREGYVVYEDTRRAAAGRRLDRTLELLRDEGIAAHGLVVDADPVSAVRDAIAQLEPDAIVISTHPESKSGWLRRDVVERVRSAAGSIPVEHVVVEPAAVGAAP